MISLIGTLLAVACFSLAFYAVYRYFKSRVPVLTSDDVAAMNRKMERAIQNRLGLQKNPGFVERYAGVLDATQKELAEFEVWGQYIFNGVGYAIFVSDKTSIACFQVRSEILVDGKPVLNDLMDQPEEERQKALAEVWKVMRNDVTRRTISEKARLALAANPRKAANG